MLFSVSRHCYADVRSHLCLPHDACADQLWILETIYLPHVRRVFYLVMRESRVLTQGPLKAHLWQSCIQK